MSDPYVSRVTGFAGDSPVGWPSLLVDIHLKIQASNRLVGRMGEDVADALLREGVSLGLVGEILDCLEVSEYHEVRMFPLVPRDGAALQVVVASVGAKPGWHQLTLAPVSTERDAVELDQLRVWLLERCDGASNGDGRESNLSVLVVDDTDLSVELISRLLRKIGCQVRGASSGGEALALCTRHEFGLIMLDMHMPGIGGAETVRMLRQRQSAKGRTMPQIVGMSASVTPELESESTDIGMLELIAKPVSMKDLRRFVAIACQAPTVALARNAALAAVDKAPERPLEQCSALDVDGWEADESLLHRMVLLFLQAGDTEMKQIAQVTDSGKASELERRVHGFKGGADVIRALRVAAVCKEILDQLRNGAEALSVRPLVTRLSKEFEATRVEATRLGLFPN